MFIIKMPNADTMMGAYMVCPKEIMQEAWLSKVGTYIDWTDRPGADRVKRKIISVTFTDDEVIVEIE